MGLERGGDDNLRTSISAEDIAQLRTLYDKDGSGDLSRKEILQMVHDYNMGRVNDPAILAILSRYDKNHDGHIDLREVMHFEQSVFAFQESQLRYTGYTIGLARILRYLAFSSEFGEALRPVVHARIVGGTYAIAFAYCVADVGWEAYKLKENDFYHEKTKEKMTLTQCIVERATFQTFASIVVPAAVIHTSISVANLAFRSIGRFTKWGPSLVGLSLIPFFPQLIDAPVEKGIEYFFHNYGPWARNQKQH